MTVCKKFFIAGQVQGVWFRASTQEQAVALGLTGYAQNLADGRVEVLACGTKHQVDTLEAWLWQGPPHARVETVDTQEIKMQQLSQFTIR